MNIVQAHSIVMFWCVVFCKVISVLFAPGFLAHNDVLLPDTIVYPIKVYFNLSCSAFPTCGIHNPRDSGVDHLYQHWWLRAICIFWHVVQRPLAAWRLVKSTTILALVEYVRIL